MLSFSLKSGCRHSHPDTPVFLAVSSRPCCHPLEVFFIVACLSSCHSFFFLQLLSFPFLTNSSIDVSVNPFHAHSNFFLLLSLVFEPRCVVTKGIEAGALGALPRSLNCDRRLFVHSSCSQSPLTPLNHGLLLSAIVVPRSALFSFYTWVSLPIFPFFKASQLSMRLFFLLTHSRSPVGRRNSDVSRSSRFLVR